MNEHELRAAMRGAMADTQTPRAMDPTTMLDTAKRVQRRRRAIFAGAASAGAVVAIAISAIVVTVSMTPGTVEAGGQPRGVGPVATEPNAPAPVPEGKETKPSWPDGQTDRTARQGPRYEKGAQLLDLLATSLPAGLQSPPDLKPADPKEFYGELRNHQAQFADEIAGKQIWEYQAAIPVGANDRWGRLLVLVISAGNATTGNDCGLSPSFWGLKGTCEPVTVGGAQVGITSGTRGDAGNQFEQWAGYRHADGTVVFVAQSATYAMSGLPALADLPLTPQQLAALAADPKFHLQ